MPRRTEDVMEARECPECGAVTNPGDNFDFPNCPNGHGEISEEGLLHKAVINIDGSETYVEVGKEGVIVCRGENSSEKISTLLETILRMEIPERTETGTLDFAQASARKWNRKRAKRRFNRWLRENNNDLPPIKDARLRDLAARLIEDTQKRIDASSGWTSDDVLRWGADGFLNELKAYEVRKDGEPVLLVRGEIPDDITQAFRQARECYRWGLYAASFGLCRIILDAVVTVINERKREVTWPPPLREEFKPILNSIPSDLLSDKEKSWARKFWERSSNFLHGRGALPGEDDAWGALSATATILDRLAGREAFSPP